MYTQKDFTHLLGLEGFSDQMLTNHFTLYAGYVTNSNKLAEKLDALEKGSMEYYELKRRLGWEVNGVKLHELYFENMTHGGVAMSDKVKNMLIENYESIDEYMASLNRNALIRGIGWVVLVQDESTGRVFHTFVGEHNIGNLVGAKILLVMDMWEHAYMTDYGIKKADYVASFVKSIDWSVVEQRLG